jgi:hypothetical protein
MITRLARHGRVSKAQRPEIEFVDKDTKDANRAVLANIIVHTGRQKELIPTVTFLDERPIPAPPVSIRYLRYHASSHSLHGSFRERR